MNFQRIHSRRKIRIQDSTQVFYQNNFRIEERYSVERRFWLPSLSSLLIIFLGSLFLTEILHIAMIGG